MTEEKYYPPTRETVKVPSPEKIEVPREQGVQEEPRRSLTMGADGVPRYDGGNPQGNKRVPPLAPIRHGRQVD